MSTDALRSRVSRWNRVILCAALPILVVVGGLACWEGRYREDSAARLFTSVTVLGSLLLGALLVAGYLAVHKAMVGREAALAEAQHARDSLKTTLSSIGDAVISTDTAGRVVFANKVAQSLLRASETDIIGEPLDDVFRIVNEYTRGKVESPVTKVLREGVVAGLANHTVLIGLDGSETPIDDSAAPISSEGGSILGTVLVFRDISEQRRAESARQLHASVVESSDDAIITKDLNGIITSWNLGAERTFGYSAEEMIGQPISILAAPNRVDEMPGILQRIRRGERIDHYQTLRRTKAGKQIHISLTVSPVRDPSGQIIGASKIARDITAQVEAQEALAEERERLRVTLSSIGDAVIATDTAGRVSYLNPVAEQLTGWTSVKAAGQPLEEVFRIVNEESRRPAENPVIKVLREGGVVGLANHTLLVARDGKPIAIDDSAAPIRSVHGEMLGVVLVFRDITARRRAEETLRRSEERLGTILNHLPVGVGVIDAGGHVELGNPLWERFLRGNSVLVANDEDAPWSATTGDGQPRPRYEYLAMRALRGEEVLPGIDFRRKDEDGVERWTRIGAVPLRDPDGRITGALTMLQDINEERRAEEQRAELLARERALAAERALRESEAELARVVRALSVGELATSIAHEINQPLAGVVTNAEAGLRWLSGEAPNIQEARESLALITRDGNRASAVIRRIRDFLKKESQQTASLDLNEVIREAVALAHAEVSNRDVLVRMDLGSDLPRVRGDRIQLQQVTLNLVMNGAEAMASIARPKELHIQSEKSMDGFCVVTVRDSGVGVSSQDMPRMFEAFFTTKPAGMGMGLSISRSIIEAHGGQIWAALNDGPGLTVQFSVPAETSTCVASNMS